jgi:hypothetical protein
VTGKKDHGEYNPAIWKNAYARIGRYEYPPESYLLTMPLIVCYPAGAKLFLPIGYLRE